MFGFGFNCAYNYNISPLFFCYSYNADFGRYFYDFYHHDSNCTDNDYYVSSSILAGTTNTDGTGSSVDLTLSNASLSLIGDGSVSQDGVTLTHTTTNDFSETFVYVSNWNQSGYKEVKIDNSDDATHIDGVVDIDIVNTNSDGVDIEIMNVKRGQVQTSCGDDNIDISVYSNNSDWINKFVIDTGAGNDSLIMSDNQNSSYTSLSVNMGNGNDDVDIAGLSPAGFDSVIRDIDGGSGFDTIKINSDCDISFTNFELIKGNGEQITQLVDSDLLATNSSSCYGLVISDMDLVFDSDISSISTDSLSCCEAHYLDSLGLNSREYIALDVLTSEGSYNIYTNDADGFC